ncbi:MAG: ArsB/NhaD family transporter [Ktedonobacterales bacterium]
MTLISLHAIAAALVLMAVLALVIVRPKGLEAGWAAGAGAALVLVFGLLTPRALAAIFGDTWDAAATLIALFVLSEALDANGFFAWAALRLAHAARGSGWRLYMLALLLTTGVTALLANDGAVLMLTPIFAKLLTAIYPKRRLQLPLLFAAGFLADAMSVLFVPSNLTNIIVADANHLTFLSVAAHMALPAFGAFIAVAGAFALRFRGELAARYDVAAVGDARAAVRDRAVFVVGWGVLAALVVGYALAGELGLPVAIVAASAALIMLVLIHIRGLRTADAVLRAAPWTILVYALGMFVVITAAYNAHDLAFLTRPLQAFAAPAAGARGALAVGGIMALLAGAVNNLPATLLGVLALRAGGHVTALALYALLIGVDIGAKLTLFGSLATLLWLGILRRHGIQVRWGEYLRENWWVAVLALAAAFAGLLLTAALMA